jgi:hypothetical protein
MLLADDQRTPNEVHVSVGDDLLVECRGCCARVDGDDERNKQAQTDGQAQDCAKLGAHGFIPVEM